MGTDIFTGEAITMLEGLPGVRCLHTETAGRAESGDRIFTESVIELLNGERFQMTVMKLPEEGGV
jgi:hypothetical protein